MIITIVITILATPNKAPTPSKKWNQIKIQGFFRIQTHSLCISATVLCHLGYEEPLYACSQCMIVIIIFI